LEKIDQTLQAAAAAAKAAREAGAPLARALGVAEPADIASLESLAGAAALALEAPDLRGIPPIGPAWDRPDAVKALAETIERSGKRRGLLANSGLIGQAWEADVLAARGDLVADGGSWWKLLFSGKFKAAKRKMMALCASPAPTGHEELIRRADRILEAQRLKTEIAERAGGLRALIGDRAVDDDLAKIKDWAVRFRARKLPESVGQWVVTDWDRKAVAALHAAAHQAAAVWRGAAAKVR